jgi:hypothetical protein
LTNSFTDDMWGICYPDLSLEFGFENTCTRSYIDRFKRMILNHVSLQYFKPYIEQRNYSESLTTAIIEIIDDLCNSKKASQIQLLVGFNYVLQHAQVFATMRPSYNVIDIKMLCSYLQTLPTISPLCALAMINQIPPSIYLYNMIAPDENSETELPGYILLDRSYDQTIPPNSDEIRDTFDSYFNKKKITYNFDLKKVDSALMLIKYLAASEGELGKKVINIVNTFAQCNNIPIDYIFAFGPIHIIRIITIINTQLKLCTTNNMFKENFFGFIKGIVCYISPLFSDKIGSYLTKNAATKPPEEISYLIIILSISMMENILNSPNDIIIPFAIEIAKKINPEGPRHLIRRILVNDRPKIGPKTKESLLECNDIIILLTFADALLNATMVHTCSQRDEKLQLLKSIMDKLPFVFAEIDHNNKRIEILSIKPQFDANLFNLSSLQLIEEFKRVFSTGYNIQYDNIFLFQLIIFSTEMRNRSFATQILSKISSVACTQFDREEAETASSKLTTVALILTKNDITASSSYSLALLQQAIQQAILFGHEKEALNIIRTVEKVLMKDDVAVHWIYLLLYRFRPFLKSEPIAMNSLSNIINARIIKFATMGDESDLRINANAPGFVYKIIRILLNNDMPLIQSPTVITNEYLGPYFQALVVTQCQVLLSNLLDIEIFNELSKPLSDDFYLWDDKVSALTHLGKFVSGLSPDITISFIKGIANKLTPDSVICGRVLLATMNIDLFVSFIKDVQIQADKLELFMQMLLPSFYRVYGDKSAAKDIIFILLNNIQTRKAGFLNTVIDVIGFLYIKLELYEFREEILARSREILLDSSASTLEAYLDPRFEQVNRRPFLKPKQVTDQPKKKNKSTI